MHRSGLEGELERQQSLLGIPNYGEDVLAPGHLHEVVGRMGRYHELGQSWVPKDGVVWEADVGDVEADQLGAVVVACAEGDGEADLPQRVGPPPPTPEKGFLRLSRLGGTRRRLKASTESKLRPAPPLMRVLVTTTLQMVGVGAKTGGSWVGGPELWV